MRAGVHLGDNTFAPVPRPLAERVPSMPTLSELAAERRAKIDAFTYDLYDEPAVYDISDLNDAIQKAPVSSKADALAALDLIRDQTDPAQHLSVALVGALRKYIEATHA